MVNLNWSKAFCEFKRLFKKGLIIMSLLMLTSCNVSAPKPTPVAQELGQLANGSVIEGQFTDSQYKAARKVIEQAPGEVEIYANSGVIHSVITGSTEIAGQTPEERISSYFDENADLYQIGKFSQTFEPVKQFDQASGVQVRQYQQVVEGIPVYQTDIRLLLDAEGKIALVNSNYMPDSNIPSNLKPKMNSTEASRAMQALGFVLPEDGTPSLVIYSPAMLGEVERSFLAWVAKAGWDGGFGDVLIKDLDGSLVLQSTDILTFSYEISDCGGEVYSSNHLPTSAEIATKPKLASSGSAFLGKMNQDRIGHLTKHFSYVFDLYERHFGYYDYLTADPEIQVLININYKVDILRYSHSPFYWRIDDSSVPILIAFPDPDFEDSVEIITHEFQHSVTEDFVKLSINDESKALNESFSDFFGALADESEFRWQVNLGKTIYRDVANPRNPMAISQGPDHVSGLIKGGDPHQNGLIYAHALYLLSEGGQKGSINVLGIGIENVAQIVFRSLALMNNNATFQQARNAMVLTCENMVHEGNTPESYCYQLKNALAAVGIGAPGSIYPVDTPPYEGLRFGWQLSPNLNFGKSPDVYAEIADLGFSFVREVFPWNLVQQQKNGPIDLNFGSMEHETWTQSVKDNKLQVMATLVGPPPTSDQSDEDFLTEWSHFLEMIVPELTETVDYWQIGNQMNTNSIWKSFRASAQGADPALYGKMLRIAYEIIKVNESSDLVIIGGLNNLSGQEVGGLDPLSFLKGTLQTCQPHCFDMVGLYLEWGEYLPEEKRPLNWNGNQIYVNMADYLNIVVQDVTRIVGTSKPIWITGMGLDADLPSLISEKQKIDLDAAQTDLLVKTIVSLSSNKAVQTVFYNDLSDALGQGADSDLGTMVHLLSGSVPQGRYPVYSQTGEAIEEASQYRFSRESELDAAFVWSNDPTIWDTSARIETIEELVAEAYKFADYPDPENRADISYGVEFTLKKEIMLLLAEMNSQDKLIVGSPNNIDHEQIKICNWGNPEFYLTYDPAYWETTEYDFLVSKSLPDCHIAANGFRDGGPEGPPPYTYASDTKILDGIEYFIDIEIPDATGIPDMFHVYWDKQNEGYQYAVALFPGPEYLEECVAAFWEVMELSRANDFSEVPGLAP